jgi:hypothetical protein
MGESLLLNGIDPGPRRPIANVVIPGTEKPNRVSHYRASLDSGLWNRRNDLNYDLRHEFL